MAMRVLDTAISGLMAFQRSLETTSHNISNVNTEGYSRQRVELDTKAEQFVGAGFIGNGTKIGAITRGYDQFISNQFRSSTSAFNDADRYRQAAEQVNGLVADPATGMSPALKSFFNAVNEVADDPSSIPARQVLLSEAGILTRRFATMTGRFEDMRSQVNEDVKTVTDQINTYGQSIAELNLKIEIASGRSSGKLPNDLLDERDRQLSKLAELVDVSVVPTNSNMITVFIGKGQPLVMDGSRNELAVQPSRFDPFHLEIGQKQPDGSVQDITRQMTGGKMAGILRFRDEILEPSRQKLGALAASIALEFNQIHRAGYDLEGNPGQDFFSAFSNVPVIADPSSTGTVTAGYDAANISQLKASDFRLDVGSGPSYTLTRLSDNTTISLSDDGSGNLVAGGSDSLPGIRIAVSGVAAGDSFLLRPAYSAAQNFTVSLSDPVAVAAATNLDDDGTTIINGPMPGDNRNALLLAGLENQSGMLGGTATFQDAYGQLVSGVGGLSNAARVSSAAQETLLNNAKQSWSEVSGVNLDEEAANLIKFQQSYQAAAQVVSVTSSLFNSLLNGLN